MRDADYEELLGLIRAVANDLSATRTEHAETQRRLTALEAQSAQLVASARELSADFAEGLAALEKELADVTAHVGRDVGALAGRVEALEGAGRRAPSPAPRRPAPPDVRGG